MCSHCREPTPADLHRRCTRSSGCRSPGCPLHGWTMRLAVGAGVSVPRAVAVVGVSRRPRRVRSCDGGPSQRQGVMPVERIGLAPAHVLGHRRPDVAERRLRRAHRGAAARARARPHRRAPALRGRGPPVRSALLGVDHGQEGPYIHGGSLGGSIEANGFMVADSWGRAVVMIAAPPPKMLDLPASVNVVGMATSHIGALRTTACCDGRGVVLPGLRDEGNPG